MASRQEQKARTRDVLKQAALALLTDPDGELRIDTITKQAGVAHGTFYVHFPSTGALVDELLADFDRDLVATVVAALPDEADSLDAILAQIARTYFAFWQDHRAHLDLYARRLAAAGSLHQLLRGTNETARRWTGQAAAALHALAGYPTDEVVLVLQSTLAVWQRVGMSVVIGEIAAESAVGPLTRLTLGMLRAAFPELEGAPVAMLLAGLRTAGAKATQP